MKTEKSPKEASKQPSTRLTRRNFMRSGSGLGVGLIVTSKTALGQAGGIGNDSDLHVALIGCGAQGTALMGATRPIEGIKFKAVCDIWEYNRRGMWRRLKAYKHPISGDNAYMRAEEMFEKEKNIDAVLVATPDFVHHTYAIMAMQAGYPCYCEKMMSNELDYAKQMVLAQRETGKLLQIGHQRRSNPRYIHAKNEVVNGNKLLGWVTHAYAQWNRAVSQPLGVPKKYPIDDATLKEFGYDNALHFRNWRMFKKYGGGAISDLGAHQIDLFNWMFDAVPKSVVATGGVDYYPQYEHYDNVMCIYEYELPHSKWDTKTYKSDDGETVLDRGDNVTSRAYYQVLTTTGSQNFYEKFMGENGSVAINETGDNNQVYREAHAPEWQEFSQQSPPVVTKEGVIEEAAPVYHKFWQHPKPWTRPTPWLATNSIADVRATKGLDPWELPVSLDKPAHTPHLENFYDTVRNGGKQEDLNCPVIDGYKTAVTVLKVNEAVATGGKIEFKPEDFEV